MCSECGWEAAVRNMAVLKSFKLAAIDRWVRAKRHIVERQWKAIMKIADAKDMEREIDVPDYMKDFD